MQDIVKILKYIAPVLSAFLLVPGCAEEEIYEKGQPENPDCYGVWFPTQTASTNLFLESDDPTEVTYKVRRTKVIDEITVPVVVSASEDGIFEVEPLVFAAGEEEADLKVTFPNAQMGVTYTCDIKVEDPDYVQIYGSNSTGLSFTVLRADWKSLGTGKWRDDIFSSLYNVTNSYAEIDVEIFEREDSPGYYRMQVFTQQLIEALFGVGVQTQGLMTIVDATDPEAVYIPVQETGVELSSTDGSIKIGSYVSENFSLDASDSQYGTMTEGVITFPQQSIAVNFSTMGDLWYSANTSGMLRIMLPGAKVYDYNVKFTKSEPANGSVTIGVDLSDDVAFMGYKVFEGALDDAQAAEQVEIQVKYEGYIARQLEEIETNCYRAVILKDGVVVEDIDMTKARENRCQNVIYTLSDGTQECFTYTGSMNDLVARLAKLDLSRLEIRDRSVSEEFLKYYEGDEA